MKKIVLYPIQAVANAELRFGKADVWMVGEQKYENISYRMYHAYKFVNNINDAINVHSYAFRYNKEVYLITYISLLGKEEATVLKVPIFLLTELKDYFIYCNKEINTITNVQSTYLNYVLRNIINIEATEIHIKCTNNICIL